MPQTPPNRDYGALREYATPQQQRILDAIQSEGGYRAAARKLAISNESVRRSMFRLESRASRSGYAPAHDMTRTVPDGFVVKGVSTLYDAAGNVSAQWVKSKIDPSRQEELMREAAESFAAELPRAAAVPSPGVGTDNLMAVYPIGDHHIGMLSWGEETGADYDTGIAERMLCGAMDALVTASPACSRAAVVVLGDFTDFDGYTPTTPTSGHILDVDSRFPKVVGVAIRSIRYAIRSALSKHTHVDVIVELGNHDMASSVWLRSCLAAVYEEEPRVSIDTSPRLFHYLHFGANLIGVHHGHGVRRLDDLPLLMATDVPDMWAASKHRYWYTGHIHQDKVRDLPGCRVESFRVLPPGNAWAYGHGYRSHRDMKAIILHRTHGEVGRHVVNQAMILDGV